MSKTQLPTEIQNIKVAVNFFKEGKHVIAYAPTLDLSTVGATEAQAKKMFEEIVKIFFEDMVQRNVVDEVLSELGWKKSTKAKLKWIPPRVKLSRLNIPVAA